MFVSWQLKNKKWRGNIGSNDKNKRNCKILQKSTANGF